MEKEYLDLLMNLLVDIENSDQIEAEDELFDLLFENKQGLNVGQNTIPYYIISPVGHFMITDKGLDVDDIPSTDIAIERKSAQTYKMSAFFSYTIDDMDEARFSRLPLPSEKAENNYITWVRDAADIAWRGDRKLNIFGLANHPNIGNGSFSPGASGDTAWSTKTGQELYDDLAVAAYDSRRLDSREKANTIVLPPDYMNMITTTYLDDNSNKTVLTAFLESHRHIQYVEEQTRLEEAYFDQASGEFKDIMLVLDNRRTRIERAMPRPYTLLNPERRGPAFKVYAIAKTAGAIVKRPQSVRRFILN